MVNNFDKITKKIRWIMQRVRIARYCKQCAQVDNVPMCLELNKHRKDLVVEHKSKDARIKKIIRMTRKNVTAKQMRSPVMTYKPGLRDTLFTFLS